MNFDFPYTEEEKALLRNWQHCQVQCFARMHRFMQAEGLAYWMDCGSLLGAFRHNGFIPWDDDLDAAMLEDDFTRLSEIVKRDFRAGHDVGIRISLTDHDPCHIGISLLELPEESGIDIYCMQRFRHAQMTLRLKHMYNLLFGLADRFQFSGTFVDFLDGERRWYPTPERIWSFWDSSRSLKKRLLFLGLLPMTPLLRISVPSAAVFVRSVLNMLQASDGECVSYHVDSRFHCQNVIMMNMVFPLSCLEFEEHSFYTPGKPEEYLTGIFGEHYDKPPPFSARRPNHYTLEELRHFLHIISEAGRESRERDNASA